MSISATVTKVFAMGDDLGEGASWTSLASKYVTGWDLSAAQGMFSESG